MPSLRHERVRELLKRTIGNILRREFNTSEHGLVSVNDVGLANDLHSATVFVSVLGSKTQRDATAQRLTQDRSHLQYIFGKEMVLKYTPKIKFELSDAIAEGDRVLLLLDELEEKANRTSEEAPQNFGKNNPRAQGFYNCGCCRAHAARWRLHWQPNGCGLCIEKLRQESNRV